MRTVVSTIGTVSHGTSAFLVDLIQPTLDKNEIRIKNSSSFVEEAKTWVISQNEVQVSFDVVALYPSVPIAKAIDVMMDIISDDFEDVKTRTNLDISDIRILLQLCLAKCYFLWQDELYEIDDTGPIGLSLMVVIAEGFLQFIERNAINEALQVGIHLKTYRRYVDDSHARFDSGYEDFLKILNSQDEHIQYTVETQDDDSTLSFLDITLINDGSGKYGFKVFRKPAITNVMLKPSSSVDPKMIEGVFKGFLARAKRICSDRYLHDEIEFLIKVFEENGHNAEKLRMIAKDYTKDSDTISEENSSDVGGVEKQPVACIPWVPVLGPKLRKLLKKRGVKTVFTAGRNLKDILCNHKTKLAPNSYPGIYKLSCECGGAYIGETKRKISVRIAEHEKDVFNGRWDKSGASEHAKTCTSSFKWSEGETMAVESNYMRRKVREALEIRKMRRTTDAASLNRDQGNILTNSSWDVLLGKLASII